MIPQAFIEDLLGRVSIGDVIGSRIELKPKGGELVGVCPFHDDSKPSLAVSPDKGVYLCRACQASGNTIGFLREYDGLGFVEAVEALAAMAGVEVPREGGTSGPPVSTTAPLFDLMQRAAEQYRVALDSDAGREASAYLERRGVTAELIDRFAIGYAPPGWDFVRKRFAGRDEDLEKVGLLSRSEERGTVYDRFRDRVMFPIRDGRGRVVGFGGRVLDGGGDPKYMNSPETDIFHKRRELYGLHEIRASRAKYNSVLLVEGYMDVVGLAAQGINNSVAVLGTAATEEHFRTLFRMVGEVVCCFDGDAAGRGAAWRAVETLLPLMEGERQVRFLFLPDGEDPDSFARARGGDGFRAALDESLTLSTFMFQHIGEGLNLDLLDDQAVLKARADKLIAKVPPGAWRDLLQQRSRQLAGFVPRGAPRRARTPKIDDVPRPKLTLHGLRIALTDPQLAAQVDPARLDSLAELPDSGASVLAEVLRLQRSHPGADAAWLVGRFSDSEAGNWLHRALQMPMVGTQLAELEEVINRLLTVKRRLSEDELADGGFNRLMGALTSRHAAGADD